MHTMHTDERKPVDKNCALILIDYRMICLCGLPALGAGSRRFKSSRPDQYLILSATKPAGKKDGGQEPRGQGFQWKTIELQVVKRFEEILQALFGYLQDNLKIQRRKSIYYSITVKDKGCLKHWWDRCKTDTWTLDPLDPRILFSN